MPEWVCTMGPPGRGRRSAPTHADQLVGVEVHRWQNVSACPPKLHSINEFCPQAQLFDQHRITMSLTHCMLATSLCCTLASCCCDYSASCGCAACKHACAELVLTLRAAARQAAAWCCVCVLTACTNEPPPHMRSSRLQVPSKPVVHQRLVGCRVSPARGRACVRQPCTYIARRVATLPTRGTRHRHGMVLLRQSQWRPQHFCWHRLLQQRFWCHRARLGGGCWTLLGRLSLRAICARADHGRSWTKQQRRRLFRNAVGARVRRSSRR